MTALGATRTAGLDRFPEVDVEIRREDARRRIAYWVVATYLFLLLVNIGLPIGLYMAFREPGAFTIGDVKDLTSLITGALASLVGILGFVVGYYFKSLEDKKN